jgi:hypothetical protein
MDATHWMTTVTNALQQGTQALTPARPLGDLLMPYVHEFSIAALAAAVVTLGCVMLLELRALAALRRNVDAHLARVFEQLDLIRFDHVQLLEAHARIAGGMAVATPTPKAAQTERAVTGVSSPISTMGSVALTPPAIAAGEARLLASLAEARARRAAAERPAAQLSTAAR